MCSSPVELWWASTSSRRRQHLLRPLSTELNDYLPESRLLPYHHRLPPARCHPSRAAQPRDAYHERREHSSSEGHEMLKRNDKYYSVADDVPIPKT